MKIENEIEKLQESGWIGTFKHRQRLIKFIKGVKGVISPKREDIFNAFNELSPETTRVLILGQDPYPSQGRNEGRAHGYAFSFGPDATNKEPEDSLLNIYKAIKEAYNPPNSKIKTWNTNLATWAKENKVLLLNTALTYESKEKTDTHIEAWRPFIKEVVKNLLTCSNDKLVVFLWGDKAKATFFDLIKEKKTYMSIKRQMLVLISNHPSNSSVNRGGNFPILAPNHFKACNDFLGENARIKWEDI